MEGVMDMTQLIRKIQLISNPTNSGRNPKLTNESGPQLAPLPNSDDTFPRRHLQQNKISHLKLEIRTTLISITFFTALCNSQPVTHLLNQLSGLKHHLSASYNSMPNLPPTNWSPRPLTIQHLKRGLINTSMITIVI